MKEVWKHIPGYEGFYKISNHVRIKSLTRKVTDGRGTYTIKGGPLVPILNGGYLKITLCKEGNRKQLSIHRIIGELFVPNPNNLPFINHLGKDENGKVTRLDNRPSSLEWSNQRENVTHGRLDMIKSSVYPGVSFVPKGNVWRARIWIERKSKHLGYFTTEKEAGIAYQKALDTYNLINKYAI
jgi:hypothetical protein